MNGQNLQERLQPAYRFVDAEEPLAGVLNLSPSVFAAEDHHWRQFEYITEYVRAQGCESLVVESHYVDRDYMEEHSVFYSRALSAVPNYCQRVHFFNTNPEAVRTRISALVSYANASTYKDECRRFSEEAYLGFMVVRPLPGSPVGRTVLRPAATAGEMRTTHPHAVHLLGVTLTVDGLAFQQQDVGVSACATTALWTCLQNAATYEDIAPAAPAQITTLASRYALPSGRSMPSEGLSAAQMSQAIHAVGLSPNLLRVVDTMHARRLLLAVAVSGFAPVLLLKAQNHEDYHAVVLSGVDLAMNGPFKVATAGGAILESASLVVGFTVNDDRIGPYVPAKLDSARNDATIVINPPVAYGELRLEWTLTHILLALHTKIRFSFGGLQTAMSRIIRKVTATIPNTTASGDESVILAESWIERGHTYMTDVIAENGSHGGVIELLSAFALPRYVAVVRFAGKLSGTIDVLFDTTSTERNLVVLAVLKHSDGGPAAADVAATLAAYLQCAVVQA